MIRSLLLVSIVALFFPPTVMKPYQWVVWVVLALVANSYYWIWHVASEQVVQSRNQQSLLYGKTEAPQKIENALR